MIANGNTCEAIRSSKNWRVLVDFGVRWYYLTVQSGLVGTMRTLLWKENFLFSLGVVIDAN